jgi:exodeoxyribonuclease V alpha subunit
MTELLARLVQQGALGPVDRHFALMLGRLAPSSPPEALLAAALASRAVTAGNVCVDLERLAAAPLLDAEGRPIDELRLPTAGAWRALLAASEIAGDADAARPLVLAGSRLYLYRWFDYERRLASALLRRARTLEEADPRRLRQRLDRLFPAASAGEPDLARLAAVIAATRRLAVVCGGPGTGKTTVVARLLVLLAELWQSTRERLPRIRLLAPTGKAAQRLSEAIAAALGRLELDADLAAAIPASAMTVHRALGWRTRTPTRFAHDLEHPLPDDVVVLDEASMVDLALMTKLVEAVRPEAHLILLGDRDQLASVEAGAILGDLCGPDGGRRWSQPLSIRAAELGCGTLARRPEPDPTPPLADCIVQLVRSWRYAETSGIARLARALNAGDSDTALAVLAEGGDARLLEADGDTARARAVALAAAGFRGLFGDRPIAARLEALSAFRVLCAHRAGRLGVEGLGAAIEAALLDEAHAARDGEPYVGRPLLVTRNDHQLELYNGDLGVVDRDPAGRLRACFPSPTGVRALPLASLPPHETAYACTVHKSQGSELDEVVLVLPDEPSPVTTRELVYTAVTRARRRVTVIGKPDVLRAAVAARIQRDSGLSDALWTR